MTQPGKPLGMSDFFGLEAGESLGEDGIEPVFFRQDCFLDHRTIPADLRIGQRRPGAEDRLSRGSSPHRLLEDFLRAHLGSRARNPQNACAEFRLS